MTIYEKPRSEVFASNAPPSEIRPFDAWLRGLGIAFDETNGFPEMESFNGLLQALSIYIKYLEQRGLAEWRNDLEYPVGAGVQVGLSWYRAKQQNLNKPPATSQNDWELLVNAAALSYVDPLYIENNVVKIRDATTTQKGVARFANESEVNSLAKVNAIITPNQSGTIIENYVRQSALSKINYTQNNYTAMYSPNMSSSISIGSGGDVRINANGTDVAVINSFGDVKTKTWMYAQKYVGADGGDAIFQGNVIGNAATATKLQTTRKLWGSSFDGSSDISGEIVSSNFKGATNATLTAASGAWVVLQTGEFQATLRDNGKFVSTGGFVGDLLGNVTGNAATTTKLQTTRTINGVAFDGTANINIPTATTSTVGTVRLATNEEAQTGAKVSAAITPDQAMLTSFGFGQKWVDVTRDRVGIGGLLTHTNNTSKPITVNISAQGVLSLYVDGIRVSSSGTINWTSIATPSNPFASVSAIVPPGSTYKLGATTTFVQESIYWTELR